MHAGYEWHSLKCIHGCYHYHEHMETASPWDQQGFRCRSWGWRWLPGWQWLRWMVVNLLRTLLDQIVHLLEIWSTSTGPLWRTHLENIVLIIRINGINFIVNNVCAFVKVSTIQKILTPKFSWSTVCTLKHRYYGLETHINIIYPYMVMWVMKVNYHLLSWLFYPICYTNIIKIRSLHSTFIVYNGAISF